MSLNLNLSRGVCMISEETIRKIADLARLELTDQEVHLYSKQLGAIMEYVSELKKVDTSKVLPMVTPTEITEFHREDVILNHDGAEAALSNAPERAGNLYKVPAVL